MSITNREKLINYQETLEYEQGMDEVLAWSTAMFAAVWIISYADDIKWATGLRGNGA